MGVGRKGVHLLVSGCAIVRCPWEVGASVGEKMCYRWVLVGAGCVGWGRSVLSSDVGRRGVHLLK